MKITLRTVAEAAGVSVATVDRVLNRRDGVRSVTIEKVESAIRQLGYAPSRNHRPDHLGYSAHLGSHPDRPDRTAVHCFHQSWRTHYLQTHAAGMSYRS